MVVGIMKSAVVGDVKPAVLHIDIQLMRRYTISIHLAHHRRYGLLEKGLQCDEAIVLRCIQQIHAAFEKSFLRLRAHGHTAGNVGLFPCFQCVEFFDHSRMPLRRILPLNVKKQRWPGSTALDL